MLIANLVGSRFYPPANAFLQILSHGHPLVLMPEPTNPYDDKAIKVMLEPSTVTEAQWEQLRPSLSGYGLEVDELKDRTAMQLGHIAKVSTEPFHALCAKLSQTTLAAKLTWAANGGPAVGVEE